MQSYTWLLLVIAALVGTPRADANVSSLCSSVDTCYEGGDSSTPCTISSGGCPPCVNFADDGCYVMVDSSCPFGMDCSSFFYPSTRSSASSSSSDATSGVTSSSSSTPTAAASSGSTGSSPRASAAGESVDASSDSSDSNSVLVVAMLAVALGVAIVAFVVHRLFLRARASSDENRENEGVPTPPPTEMTASFSSDGTSRYARGATMVSCSAMGTDRPELVQGQHRLDEEDVEHATMPPALL
jgi:hypothetical protein